MAEPEGREGSEGPVETGPMLEGGQVSGRSAAGAASSDSLPPLRTGRPSAADLGPESLDMLLALDEPELLLGVLKRIADQRAPSEKWGAVAGAVQWGIEALQMVNEAKSR